MASYTGTSGNDMMRGAAGADQLSGLAGDDQYFVDDAGDIVVEAPNEGFDRVSAQVSWTLRAGSSVEMLTTSDNLATAPINLTGNELSQYLFGNAGANVLDGAGGGDTLVGFGGNDVYLIRNAADRVLETADEGFDRVTSSVSFALNAGASVEMITTADNLDTAQINLIGNALSQYLFGNAGVNVLDGNGGGDTMLGFGGDDSYVVRTGDRVVEAAGEGNDRVFAVSSFALEAGSHVEILSTIDNLATTAIDFIGNDLGQYLFGNAGANWFEARGGDDILLGLDGNDRLDGGLGADRLQGGSGADQFWLTTALGGGNVDRFEDFDPASDTIVLGGAAGQPFAALASGSLDPSAFTSQVGAGTGDAHDRLLYNPSTGTLSYDADGAAGPGAAVVIAILPTGLSLTAADFTVTGAANRAAAISSGTSATIAENSAVSTIVYQTIASDPDGDSITYALGGADAALFTIDASGAVRLISPADFETRQSYNFTVRAQDSAGAGETRSVTLSVTDVNETSGPTPTVNETGSLNDSIGGAQVISRAGMLPSSNPNLFDDDLPTVTIRGNIATVSPNADLDFFAITLNAGERLILDIDNTPGGLDALVRIFDSNGNELGFVDDSPRDPGSDLDRPGTTLDSFLSWRAPSTGTYYFSVEAWGPDSDNGPGSGNSTGTYDLHVSIGPAASAQQMLEEDIEALIGSNGWSDPNPGLPGTNLTFAFPNSPSDYPSGTSEVTMNFEPFNSVQQNATSTMLQQIAGFANVTFTQLFDPSESAATLRYAMSDEPEVAYAYLPGGSLGGTAWFRNSPIGNRTSPSFDNPVPGSYSWMSIIHESGHALGLKHGHEFPAVSFDRDSVEYTVMTYRSYPGQAGNGYVNETWGYPSTMMALDIAALQRMYGPNFSFNAGDTVYSWSPSNGQSFVNGVGGPVPGGNRVFMTVWDAGGTDTYDLSNYSGSMAIDLRPGEFSLFSTIQRANLGNGHSARGNVFNAFLYNEDPRSLIENAIAGPGNDTLIANQAANRLTGGAGADTFRWHSAADAGLAGQADTVTDFAPGGDRIDLSAIDAISGTSSNDAFTFIGTSAFSGVAGQLRYAVEGGDVRIQGDLDGNGVADMEILLTGVTSLTTSEFFL